MKFKIVPPKDSDEKPFVKEFNSWSEVNEYLVSKNDGLWRANPLNEEIEFDMIEIN
ncbi:hypothetical protein [Lactiplantibacillus paraxiangfangensis]|uniref:hypothetical protein n=1 Tax=Lactiplantibacillus paraxiangfangensis TaxID=3076224 RepID=UPI0030C6C6A5